MARPDLSRQRRRELVAREAALLPLQPSGPAPAWKRVWRRGFVEHLEVDLDALLPMLDAELAAAPLLNSLRLTGVGGSANRYAGPTAPELWASRSAALAELFDRLPPGRMVTVEVDSPSVDVSGDWSDPRECVGFGDELARLLAAHPALRGLRAVGMWLSSLTSAGATALAALPALERLTLSYPVAKAHTLLTLLPGVVRLRLPETLLDPEFLAAPSPELARLVELGLSNVRDTDLAALAANPAARRLERLDLGWSPALTAAGVDALAGSRLRLESFAAHGSRLGQSGLDTLVDGPAFAGLRQLDLTSCQLGAVDRIAALPLLDRLTLTGPRPDGLGDIPEYVDGSR